MFDIAEESRQNRRKKAKYQTVFFRSFVVLGVSVSIVNELRMPANFLKDGERVCCRRIFVQIEKIPLAFI